VLYLIEQPWYEWQNIRYRGEAHSWWRRDIQTSGAIPEIRLTSMYAQKREIT
ncbi:uncharacterized protein METZ01_LOCUS84209, partial [marine metagenome]